MLEFPEEGLELVGQGTKPPTPRPPVGSGMDR